MTTPRRGAAAFAAAVTLTLVLASCGDGSTDSAPADAPTSAEQVEGPRTDADITFAQGMIPHHRQAVQMSELAQERTDTPEVLELSGEIAAAQEPEIRTMTAFLEAWDVPVPAEDMAMDMDSMDMDSMDMDSMDMGAMAGMMTPEQMADLEAAEAVEFDRLFLQMMVAHHEGAVDMAQRELDEGENPAALELAQEIIAAQESEIERMEDLLDAS